MANSASADVNISFTDVLIIGAGPSGLMAGQALARLGIKFRIIDRRLPGALYGSADGFQARTMEVWKSYDMDDVLFQKARFLRALVMYKQTDRGIEREKPSIDVFVRTRYPFEATIGVEYIEGILQEHMEKFGTYLEQPIIPASLHVTDEANDEFPVKVKLVHLNKNDNATKVTADDPGSITGDKNVEGRSEIVNAKYVIGADGAHSWVRRSLRIPMEGDQTDYIWGVIDLDMTTDFPDPLFKCIIQSENSSVIFVPREGNLTRIYVRLSSSDISRMEDGRLDRSKLDIEMSRKLIIDRISENFYPYKINVRETVWSTIFIVAQKVAAQYTYKNRIFIIGDACHTHSPSAGQGANASMNDSHNLAWKLAYVLRGWATPTILKTYEEERRHVAQDLIAFDRKLTYMMSSGEAANYNKLWYEQNLYVTGVGVQYKSYLTKEINQNLASNLTIGQRLPPGELIRLGDWTIMDIQELAPSNGLFKIIIFAGNLLSVDNNERLQTFAGYLQSVLTENLPPLVQTYTVIRGQKEQSHWQDVPLELQDIQRVFIDDKILINPSCGKLYEDFGIFLEGAVVLVRPDGYISMITPVAAEGAKEILQFLSNL